MQAFRLYQKETPTQVFSCEYCEIFKSNYFEEHLRMTASVLTVSTIKPSHKCLTGSKYVSSLVRLLFPSLSLLLTTHPQSWCILGLCSKPEMWDENRIWSSILMKYFSYSEKQWSFFSFQQLVTLFWEENIAEEIFFVFINKSSALVIFSRKISWF